MVIECGRRLNALAAKIKVFLLYMLYHKSIKGNDYADMLNMKAAATAPIGPKTAFAKWLHFITE